MRGKDEQQLDVFSYVSPEQRVPQDHPLRPLRAMTDEALQPLQPWFNKLYAKTGRPSITPEKLLRALLLQALYSVGSEQLLMEQLEPAVPQFCPQCLVNGLTGEVKRYFKWTVGRLIRIGKSGLSRQKVRAICRY